MKYLSVKAGITLTILALFTWVLTAGFSLSGFLTECPVKGQSLIFPIAKLHEDFSQYDRAYDCCGKIPQHNYSKTEYIINFNEELNFKFSSKRAVVLHHGINERLKNSSFVNNSNIISEHKIPSGDIPVITSSLLI